MSRSAMAIRLTKLEAERAPDPERPLMILSDHPPESEPAEDRSRIDDAARRGQRRLYLVKSADEQPTDEEWEAAFCE